MSESLITHEYQVVLQAEDVPEANLTRWRLLLRGVGFEDVLASSTEFTEAKSPAQMLRYLITDAANPIQQLG